MKKLSLIILLAALVSCFSQAYADTFDNTAFIGEWTSSRADDSNYAKLYIDYCDSSVINAHFKQIQNGVQKYEYILYQGTVEDNRASLKFDAYNFGEETSSPAKSGEMTLAWYVDNIWVSIYSDSGEEIYNGMVVNNVAGFNPYASPFSYNVRINLNDTQLEFSKNPAIINGTTYVPLRGTFDSMNLNVYWDEFDAYNKHTQMITAAKGSEILEIKRERTEKGNMPWHMRKWTNDSPDTLRTDYQTIDISDTQPIIIDGSSYVPLRVIAESFGADVQWNGASSTVSITYDTSCDTKKTSADIAQIEAFTPEQACNMVKSFYTTIRSDNYPYYTYKSKYYIFNCTRDGVRLVAKVDNGGNTLEYTEEEWNNMQ